ncbi:MAG: CII family transcriptional regulator [Janthinobacterium lividum]
MSTATEAAVSIDPLENTRMIAASIQSVILQRLADVTQSRAAEIMGVHASTVSRMRDDIGDVAQLLAAIGLKVVPGNAIVTDRDERRFLMRMTRKIIDAELQDDVIDGVFPQGRRATDRSAA